MAESQGYLTLVTRQVIIPKNKAGCILEARFMTVEDIARDLSVAEDTVRSWIRERKLPAYRVGKEYRIKIVDYERFLEQRRTINGDFQERD
jgi:excisionase family DNA binding protein